MTRRSQVPGSDGTLLGDEFMSREHQLPADTGALTGDMPGAGRATEALDATPMGETPPGYDVRSTYDVRPVNARDFNITVSAESATSVDLEFTVPAGHVAVIRRIRHFISNPVPASDDRNDVALTLKIDTAAVPYNLAIPVGVESDDIATYFELADENSVVTAHFDIAAGVAAAGGPITATFCGNLLAKSGRPLPFEIANPSSLRDGAVQSAPVIMAPSQPSLPAPAFTPPVPTPTSAVAQRPPFPIVWSYALDRPGPRVYYPMADVRPRRVLTPDEQFTYREYLAATKPSS